MEKNTWKQWDLQEARRIAKLMEDQAYILLNNLYLAIERGTEKLTIHTANQLRVLAGKSYPQDDPMRDWWAGEFQKLKGWNNV
jgi:hypothetical protein